MKKLCLSQQRAHESNLAARSRRTTRCLSWLRVLRTQFSVNTIKGLSSSGGGGGGVRPRSHDAQAISFGSTVGGHVWIGPVSDEMGFGRETRQNGSNFNRVCSFWLWRLLHSLVWRTWRSVPSPRLQVVEMMKMMTMMVVLTIWLSAN